MSLESELARRAQRGCMPSTIAGIKRRLASIGYKVEFDLKSSSTTRIIAGEGEGDTYPAYTLGYIREIDTGMCAFHYQARRDDNFRELQRLRREEELFAVVRGRILEI